MRLFLLQIGLVVALMSCNSNDSNELENDSGNQLDSEEINLIWNDMNLPHEGIPSGVIEGSEWRTTPRVGYGNNPPDGWNAMIPWGQVYVEEGFEPNPDIRFQIRNLQAWYLNNEGGWKKWSETSNIGGANYAEDFQNDINIESDIRNEADNGGGISANLIEGYNFHFWDADGRSAINPEDISAVFVSLEARLIIDSPNSNINLNNSHLMMGAGADYWQSMDAVWDQWQTNGDIAIGRFRFLTEEWTSHYAHTLTKEQLENNPPPIK